MPGIHHLSEHSATFDNGEEHDIDTLLLCTGYLFHVPFLDDACAIKTDGFVISNLYKHMINVDFPSMFFIGFTKEVIAFCVLDIQTKYILEVLNGSVRLPSKQTMLASTLRLTKTKPRHYISKSTAHFFHMDQFSYMDDLTTEAGLPPCPAFIEPIYHYAFESTVENLQGHRDVKIEVVGSSSFRVRPLSELPSNGMVSDINWLPRCFE